MVHRTFGHPKGLAHGLTNERCPPHTHGLPTTLRSRPPYPTLGGPNKYLSRGDRAAPRPPDAEPRAPRPRLIDLGTDLVAASGTQHRGRGAALDVAPVAVTAIATGLAW